MGMNKASPIHDGHTIHPLGLVRLNRLDLGPDWQDFSTFDAKVRTQETSWLPIK